MKIYERKIHSNEIKEELNKFEKIALYEGQDYPYHSLGDKMFEVLIYLIYEEEIKAGKFNDKYDKAHLMQAVGEKGRDVLLTYKGNYNGVIQCKNYKARLDQGEIAREIIKFVLYYLKDRNLIFDLNRFTYYLIAPNGFTEPALELLIKFNQLITKHIKLREWTDKVINKYVSIRDFKYELIKSDFTKVISQLKVEYKTAPDINLLLNNYIEVSSHFFREKKVIDEKPFRRILREELPADITLSYNDKRIPILEAIIKNLTIKYYAEGCQQSIRFMVSQILGIINRFRPEYLDKFAPNKSISFQNIISYYFKEYGPNFFVGKFRQKINNGEITYLKKFPPRDIYVHTGALAHTIYEMYNSDYKKENILIDNARKGYEHILKAKYSIFKYWEEINLDVINESLEILNNEGIIQTSGSWTGSDCIETYSIINQKKLRFFIRENSLEDLLSSLDLT